MSSYSVDKANNKIGYQGKIIAVTQEDIKEIADAYLQLEQEKDEQIRELKEEIERLKKEIGNKETVKEGWHYYTEEGRRKGTENRKKYQEYVYQEILKQVNNGKKRKEIVGQEIEIQTETNSEKKIKRVIKGTTYQRALVYGKEKGIIKGNRTNRKREKSL